MRDWLALGATSFSALFAGLIWWIARKRLRSRYEFSQEDNISPEMHGFKILIANRADATLAVERMSVKKPLSILVDETGGTYGLAANRDALAKAKRVQSAGYSRKIPPDDKASWTVVLHREGGFRSCKTVSISVHILKSFPVIRQSKKTLKAILPASMRKSEG